MTTSTLCPHYDIITQMADTGINRVESPVTVIRPLRGWVPVNLGELWASRELLYFLIWREVKVRYKQTVFGAAWAIIRPFFLMAVFTLFFGNLAKIPSEGIPYPLFSYTALLPWTLLSDGVSRSSNSLVQNSNLIMKVYFPRLTLPLAGIIAPLIDFAIAFVILIGMMFYFGYPPTLQTLWLPVFIILALMTALGVGLWLSAINVQYRDIGYAVPFFVQLWLFASPVVYPTSLLPERFQAIYGLNPMVGVIEGFRWALLGTAPPGNVIVPAVVIVIFLTISGAFYFRYKERTFADVV